MTLEVITREEFEPVIKALDSALQRIAELESRNDEWVTIEVAEKRTGKTRKTLMAHALHPDIYLLQTKPKGKRGVLFSANSLVNYNNRAILKGQEDHPLKLSA